MIDVNGIIQGADLVWLNGEVFTTSYLRVSDDETLADDVLIEAANPSGELFFTRNELERGIDLGDGSFQLPGGFHVRFLSVATVH